MNALKTPLTVAGRVLLALMFVMSGLTKLVHVQGTASHIASAGLPLPTVLAVLAGLTEAFGGLAVMTGFMARWGALALAAFTLLASVLFHPFWSVPEAQVGVTQLLFMKNMAVIGGLLLVAALGPGPASLGSRGD